MHTKFWLEMRSKLAKWSHVTLVIENHQKIGFSNERRPMLLPDETCDVVWARYRKVLLFPPLHNGQGKAGKVCMTIDRQ